MTWTACYLKDVGKSRIDDAATITGYTLVNSGNEMALKIESESMPMSKPTGQDPVISEKDSTGYYKEPEVTRNTAESRKFSLTGVLDFNDSADRTMFANLIKARRSPAVFAYSSDFTLYDDNPVNSSYNDLDNGNFDANKFVYVIVTGFVPSREATDTNIVKYSLELTYTQR